jgi:hypothetical protein
VPLPGLPNRAAVGPPSDHAAVPAMVPTSVKCPMKVPRLFRTRGAGVNGWSACSINLLDRNPRAGLRKLAQGCVNPPPLGTRETGSSGITCGSRSSRDQA